MTCYGVYRGWWSDKGSSWRNSLTRHRFWSSDSREYSVIRRWKCVLEQRTAFSDGKTTIFSLQLCKLEKNSIRWLWNRRMWITRGSPKDLNDLTIVRDIKKIFHSNWKNNFWIKFSWTRGKGGLSWVSFVPSYRASPHARFPRAAVGNKSTWGSCAP